MILRKMDFFKTSWFQRILKFVWLVLIYIDIHYSLTPTIPVPLSFDNSDKILHFFTYGILGGLPGLFSKTVRRFVFCVLVVMMVGMGLEFCQYFVPGRDFSLMDMTANNLGALSSLILITNLRRSFKQ